MMDEDSERPVIDTETVETQPIERKQDETPSVEAVSPRSPRDAASGTDHDIVISTSAALFAKDRVGVQNEIERMMLRRESIRPHEQSKSQTTTGAVTNITLATVFQGIQAIVTDDFSSCFTSQPPPPWNWNFYLAPMWLVGFIVRTILVPLRVAFFVFTSTVFVPVFYLVAIAPLGQRPKDALMRTLIQLKCRLILASWFAVVRYHGVIPSRRPNQVFVANHSSLIDFVVLEALMPFATVGQHQPGWIGFIQKRILVCMKCLWFDRKDAKERATVTRLLKERIEDPTMAPLLIFPEGVCSNNTRTVQFKRGAFELGAEVCPIAIKYNPLFSDCYWNSRHESFTRYCLRLWHSWCVVADVWYLRPHTIRPRETADQFSVRVQKLISAKAGLQFTTHNGYLKYFQPNDRFVAARRTKIAEAVAAGVPGVMLESKKVN